MLQPARDTVGTPLFACFTDCVPTWRESPPDLWSFCGEDDSQNAFLVIIRTVVV